MMVFKSVNDFGPQYMHKMFTKKSPFTERSLRNTPTDIRIPLRKSTVGQKSFSYQGARVWDVASQLSAKNDDLYKFLNPL